MEIKGMMRRKIFSLFFIVLGILSPKEIFSVVCKDDPSFQFSLMHGANVTKGCAWIVRTTDESKRQSRAQKYCAKNTSSGARNVIYNACPVACGSPCSRFNEDSSVIENDVVWHDSKGKNIKANRCGTISTKKVGGFWYMVGSEASRKWYDGGDIYIYKSKQLGSDSWQQVKKIAMKKETNTTSASCTINFHDVNNTTLIHCRKLVYVSYDGPEGDYSQFPDLDIPKDQGELGNLKVGTSTIYQEVDDLYMAISRIQQFDDGRYGKRFMFIYQLDSSWTQINRTVVQWQLDFREAPRIVKASDGLYYLFTSVTKGWRQSKTYYARAVSLESLPFAPQEEVVMHPDNTDAIQSMGTQFCSIQEFSPGKWLFMGRRHPRESNEDFWWKYGKHVMTPARFIDGKPHVYWKYKFDWKQYNYMSGDFDEHDHGGHGHSGQRCTDSEARFYVQELKKFKKCSHLQGKLWRCNRFGIFRIKCPEQCGVSC